MQIHHARTFLLSLLMLLLAACGGASGTFGGATLGNTTVGGIVLTVTGLPAGTNANITVIGSNNYSQTVTQSQTLTGLAPGTYSVTAAGVVGADTSSYVPAPLTMDITVTAGVNSSVNIVYSVQSPLSVGLTPFVGGLSEPVFLTSPPGDERKFIVERAGRIRIVQNGVLLSRPFLDISARTSTAGERGLLSVAFHPQYASNGNFFLYYADVQGNIVIERMSVSAADANLADDLSDLQILSIAHPTYTNHYGGLVSFGPDGYLYIGTGDGGGAGDPSGNAQNLDSLLGKLLRIDVNAASPLQRYLIPPSNPYALAQPGRRAEIWAYGLRNPWRYTFDAGTSLLYIADVGQDAREEVDIASTAQAGNNYGWNIMEGSSCYNSASCAQTGLVLPAFEYLHGANDVNGCSITGGYVYRGRAIPELLGRYFYSDYCGAFLKSFLNTAGVISQQTDWAVSGISSIVSFGKDSDGELYLMSQTGSVYRITRK